MQGLPGATTPERRIELIAQISRILAYESKRMATFGLPEPQTTPNELAIVREMQDARNPNQELVALLSQGLSQEQQHVFDRVRTAFATGARLLLFVQVNTKKLFHACYP